MNKLSAVFGFVAVSLPLFRVLDIFLTKAQKEHISDFFLRLWNWVHDKTKQGTIIFLWTSFILQFLAPLFVFGLLILLRMNDNTTFHWYDIFGVIITFFIVQSCWTSLVRFFTHLVLLVPIYIIWAVELFFRRIVEYPSGPIIALTTIILTLASIGSYILG